MRNSPKTEKTEDFRSLIDRDSNKASPLFRHIISKPRRALDRTLYFGEKKRFVTRVPEHPVLFDPLPLSASTSATDLPVFEPTRKTEKKRRQQPEEENFSAGYCVPETPKPTPVTLRGHKQASLDGFSLEKKGSRI
jgi:hypothetical protein